MTADAERLAREIAAYTLSTAWLEDAHNFSGAVALLDRALSECATRARADGYAQGVEASAKVVKSTIAWSALPTRTANVIIAAIRALSPPREVAESNISVSPTTDGKQGQE